MERDFTIYYQNVRGLRTKSAEFLPNLLSRDIDIIVLCETWLNEGMHSSELFDNRYSVCRADRNHNLTSKLDGGGCLIAIKTCFYSCRMTSWEMDREDIWMVVYKSNNEKIVLNVKYIDCNATLELYKSHLNKIEEIMNVTSPNDQFIMLGDYNLSESVDWVVDSDGVCKVGQISGKKKLIANAVIDTMSLTSLQQYNHVKNNIGRSLDLILSNMSHNKISVLEDSDPLVHIDVYHPALLVQVDAKPLKYLDENRLPKLNFFRANYDEINKLLQCTDWMSEFEPLNVEGATERFYELMSSMLDHVPKVKLSSSRFPCWYSTELKKAIKSKSIAHELYKEAKKMGRDTSLPYEAFSTLRKMVKRLQDQCHDKYVSDIEEKLPSNTKCFFSYTKALKASNSLPNVVEHGSKIATDRRSACNMFAAYFASVYQEPDNERIESIRPTTTFNIPHITNVEVQQILEKLDLYKVSSPDNIPAMLYRKLSQSISIPLAALYNKSLREGVFPSSWKVSFVTPTFKSGSRSKVTNYRPISILCSISKIFERIMFNRLYAYFKRYISPSQHGFVSGRSPQTNLMEYLHHVVESISNGGQVDTIFTDFSKAFDQVSHNLILQDLENLGVNEVVQKWFRSYLTGRRQFVVIGSTKSDVIIPTSGIPQGSILGPLLFLIFINNLPDTFKSSSSLLFADDHKLWKKISDTADCTALQDDLDILSNWCRARLLHLNVDKCQKLTISYKQDKIAHDYIINGKTIETVEVKKDLGVEFEGKLNFKQHIQSITRKCYRMIGFIFRAAKRFKEPNSIIRLYYSYCRSRLEYCCSVWNPNYMKYIDMIERVQKKFTRMLYYKFQWEKPSYKERLKNLGMLSLESRRIQLDEILLLKIISGQVNTTMRSEIQFHIPQRFTRNPPTFYQHTPATNYAQNAPIYRLLSNHDKYFSSIDVTNPNFRISINRIKGFFEF